MAEQRHAIAFGEAKPARLTVNERAALSAFDTLDAVQVLLNGFSEGKPVTLAGIQSCRTMIDVAMKDFFIYPRQQAASIGRRAALQRAYLTTLEGILSSSVRGTKN